MEESRKFFNSCANAVFGLKLKIVRSSRKTMERVRPILTVLLSSIYFLKFESSAAKFDQKISYG